VVERGQNIKQLINIGAFKIIALDTRTGRISQGQAFLPKFALLTCEVIDSWLSGAYNFFYAVQFSDGVIFLVRLAGKGGRCEDKDVQKHNQEYQTLCLICRSTKIPVPEVFLWSSTPDLVGRPFALLPCLPGTRLFDKWSDTTWATEERRLKILTQIAGYLSQLGQLRFDSVGSLVFDMSNKVAGAGSVYDYVSMQDAGEDALMARSYGLWRTAQHYQRDKGRMNLEMRKSGGMDRTIIIMASRSIPDSCMETAPRICHTQTSAFRVYWSTTTRMSPASSTGIV
jgi:hypothetical protein